jgi:hypothetical protein
LLSLATLKSIALPAMLHIFFISAPQSNVNLIDSLSDKNNGSDIIFSALARFFYYFDVKASVTSPEASKLHSVFVDKTLYS